ncbi:unnamed protein product [Cunninghamella blakesleeana]
MKKLNFFLFCYSLLVNQILTGGAVIFSNKDDIWKRDTGLPFEALPASGNCTVPTICKGMNDTLSQIQCRCNDVITLCKNKNQYCWGSKNLNRNSNCPSIPNPCQGDFNSTVSCLCNDKNVLCVDQYNHYCYGAILPSNSSANASSVSLQPLIPSSSSPSSSSSTNPSVLSSSLAASQTIAATETPNPTMSTAISFGPSSSYLYSIIIIE